MTTKDFNAKCMLNILELDRMIHEWLAEDIPSFDVGGAVVGDGEVEAVILAKSYLICAGLPFAEQLLHRLHCTVQWNVIEGQVLNGSSKERIPMGVVRGKAFAILQAQRTVLQVLSRCSATATATHRCKVASLSKNSSWQGKVACTRKTTPGLFRQVQKYGVVIGGGDPHRYGLSSMTMLKDNHIDIAGSISNAVAKARAIGGFSLMIEVQCRSIDDALQACEAGANVVMLDNFTPSMIAEAVPIIRAKFPTICIQCSGGITEQTVADYAINGVDVVSIGKLTHGTEAVDISMKIKSK